MLTPPDADAIGDEEALRSVVGRPAPATLRKIHATLDSHATQFASLARIGVAAVTRSDGRLDVAARLGGRGIAVAATPSELWLGDPPDARLGAALDAVPAGSGAGVLLLVPGLGETLRINGRAESVRDAERLASVFGSDAPVGALRIEVDEVYFHCAKALIRSSLWRSDAEAPSLDDTFSFGLRSETLDAPHRSWLARSPFALLATRDRDGRADVSPRGDPAGFVHVVDARTVFVPDRPGNRLLDSFRNVLDEPQIALLSLIPGEHAALRLRGRAAPTRDSALLETSTVSQRKPVIGLRIDVDEVTLERRPPPFVASGAWDPAQHAPRSAFPTLGRVMADQVGIAGLRGRLAGRAIDAALRRDERRNLY